MLKALPKSKDILAEMENLKTHMTVNTNEANDVETSLKEISTLQDEEKGLLTKLAALDGPYTRAWKRAEKQLGTGGRARWHELAYPLPSFWKLLFGRPSAT